MAQADGRRTFHIDGEVCSGHGRCYSLAPQWFTADEYGKGVPTGEIDPNTPEADLQFIVDSCPEEAITIVRAGAEASMEAK